MERDNGEDEDGTYTGSSCTIACSEELVNVPSVLSSPSVPRFPSAMAQGPLRAPRTPLTME